MVKVREKSCEKEGEKCTGYDREHAVGKKWEFTVRIGGSGHRTKQVTERR